MLASTGIAGWLEPHLEWLAVACLRPHWIGHVRPGSIPCGLGMDASYLSSSLAREVPALLRFGTGILHSIEKATQLVHGTLSGSQYGMLMDGIAMA